MDLMQIFQQFPTQDACLDHLEHVRWPEGILCPYCGSDRISPQKGERRYHCIACNKGFSVLVNTIFHGTHAPLQKWFLAISLMMNAKKGLSAKQLQRDLHVTYKTAWYMMHRIRKAMVNDSLLLQGIVEMDEMYLGGKPRKKNTRKDDDDDDAPKHKRGRGTEKTPVVGMIERGGKVVASMAAKLSADAMNDLVRKYVDTELSQVMTDQFRGYAQLKGIVKHFTIDHSVEYVNGEIHTNTMESFWSLVKRGVIGQFHKVSKRYLPLYLAEFCFRFNLRDHDDLRFHCLLNRAVETR